MAVLIGTQVSTSKRVVATGIGRRRVMGCCGMCVGALLGGVVGPRDDRPRGRSVMTGATLAMVAPAAVDVRAGDRDRGSTRLAGTVILGGRWSAPGCGGSGAGSQ
jgi:hypothetical protein